MHRAGFHLVIRGGCWLHLYDGRPPQALASGDLVFLARETRHVLSTELELDGDETRVDPRAEGPRTELICGSVEFEDPGAEGLMRALPAVVLVRNDGSNDARMESLARLMAGEAAADHDGRQAVLDRLSDVLLILVLRHVMSRGQVRAGLLAGLASPPLRRALNCIHRDYAHPWRLNELAGKAGLSRGAFARQFARVVGQTPMHYLAQWRMSQAERMLLDRGRSVAEVAESLGYTTEAAFRRAFKRIRGMGPGRVRRLARGHQT